MSMIHSTSAPDAFNDCVNVGTATCRIVMSRITGREASMTAIRTSQRLAGAEADDIIHLKKDCVRRYKYIRMDFNGHRQ